MHRIAERLLNRRDFGTNLRNVRTPQTLGRQFHVIGKAAVFADSNDFIVSADVRISNATLITKSANDVALRRNDIPDFQTILTFRIDPDFSHAPQ